ncbi:Dehydrogenase/reductase SDR family protein 7-like [Zostera marina]|uniref:Dehydrogenase/reductase SDR family protein 7-like n=1 Tax=Zostera marina TaxID=29655 RepID=A0A0K9NRP9_ZOSMR|nr:Dehydrogenase/reductase SDR family protein 7-like [Zostera marina]
MADTLIDEGMADPSIDESMTDSLLEETMMDPMAIDPAASSTSTAAELMSFSDGNKQGLGWSEWFRGWYNVIAEFFFQRIVASHLENPLPLPPLNGVTCIVTGSTSGIGLQIARQLAEAGSHVVMAVRNTRLAHELIHKWESERCDHSPLLEIEVMELDLLYLESVVRFAKNWNALSKPLHVLINNAGIFSLREPQKFSKDGYETHLQVNHLAPTLLSILLIPSLIRGSPSRIVNMNSIMHFVGFVDSEDMNLNSGKTKYTSLAGYANSKLAQLKFSSILQKKLPSEAGISVLCASPGIVDTNVARDLPRIIQTAYHLIPYFIFNAIEGSRSALFSAADPQVPEYCGMLKTNEWPVCAFISHECRPMNVSEEAFNLETSRRVWDKTLELIGLPADIVEKVLEDEEVECRYETKH